MRYWLTRETWGTLYVWEGEDKPFLHKGGWNNLSGNNNYELPDGLFKEVTFDKSPIEVDEHLNFLEQSNV